MIRYSLTWISNLLCYPGGQKEAVSWAVGHSGGDGWVSREQAPGPQVPALLSDKWSACAPCDRVRCCEPESVEHQANGRPWVFCTEIGLAQIIC